jgi:hypothetical protein
MINAAGERWNILPKKSGMNSAGSPTTFALPQTGLILEFPNAKVTYSDVTADEDRENTYTWGTDRLGHRMQVSVSPFPSKTYSPSGCAGKLFQNRANWVPSPSQIFKRSNGFLNLSNHRDLKYTTRKYEGKQVTRFTRINAINDWAVTMTWESNGSIPDKLAYQWFESLRAK